MIAEPMNWQRISMAVLGVFLVLHGLHVLTNDWALICYGVATVLLAGSSDFQPGPWRKRP